MINPTLPITASSNATRPAAENRLPWIRFSILVGGLLLMFGAELLIFRGDPSGYTDGSIIMLGLGLVLSMALIGFGVLNTIADPSRDPFIGTAAPVRIRLGWLTLSLLLTGWLMWRSIQKPPMAYFAEYGLIWLLAILSLAMAVLSAQKRATPDTRPFLRWEYAALLLLLIGSLLVRGIDLGHLPAIMDQDEAAFAREGTTIAFDFHLKTTPFEQGVYSYARAYQMLIGVSALLLGKTLFAARLPAMLLGAFGVPAVYLLGRELFNRSVGLLAALFMLGWAYHTLFSRIALNQAGDPVFTTLAFYFLLRGLRRRQVSDYFMAGVMFAIVQLFYLGARLAVIVLAAYLLYLFIRQRKIVFSQWRLLAVMLLVGVIVALPQHYWIYYYRQPFTTRLSEKSLFVDQGGAGSAISRAIQDGTIGTLVVNQLKYSFGGLVATSDTGGWYGQDSNILGVLGVPLLLLGALATLRVWWSRPRWLLPLLWGVAVIGSGSVLSYSPPAYERFFPGVAAYSLLVAVGIWVIGLGTGRLFGDSRAVKPLLALLGLIVLVGNLAFLVFDYLPAKGYFNNVPNWRTNRVADEMVQADHAGRYLVLVSKFQQEIQNTNVIDYYMAGTQFSYIDNTTTDLIANGYVDTTVNYSKPLTFLVAASSYDDLQIIEREFPGGTQTAAYLPEDHTLAFYRYDVTVLYF